MGSLIFLGERHLDGFFLTRLDALQAFLEAGNELPRAKRDLGILIGATFKRLTVNAPDIGHGDTVAVAGLSRNALVSAVGFANLVEACVDLFIGDIGNRAFDGDALEVGDFEIGQNLIGHGVDEIGLALQNPGGFRLVFRHGDIGLDGRLLAAVGERLAGGFGDHRLDDFRHGGLAIDVAQMGNRHLARTESVEANAAFQLQQLLRQAGIQFRGRNRHRQFAFEPFGKGFVDLHLFALIIQILRRDGRRGARRSRLRRRPAPGCGLGMVVRAEGLEPPRGRCPTRS